MKLVNFTVHQRKYDYKKTKWKFIQYIVKENLLLLKDLLELWVKKLSKYMTAISNKVYIRQYS